jgi:hypothetical protein
MSFRKPSVGISIVVVVVLVGLLCAGWLVYTYTHLTAQPLFTKTPQTTAVSDLKASAEKLKEHVTTITSVTPTRNHLNLKSLNQTAEYIENEFKKYCPQVYRQTFTVNSKEYANVICQFGEEKELIVIGAHYDVYDISIGADDNASGVAGLLELARLLKEQSNSSNIQLVAYTLEELPHFRTENMGSYKHAKSLKDRSISVKFMISLEMIGYFSQEENSQRIPSRMLRLIYPTTGNFIALIGRYNKDTFLSDLNAIMSKSSRVPVRALHAPENLLTRNSSDQLNYWKFGYEAAVVTDTGPYRNPNYDKPSDTPDTLDYESSAEVVSGVYQFLLQL